MKLVILIFAYNEADTIRSVIEEIPHSIDGIDTIETIVIDDGSRDATARIAQESGAEVVSHRSNKGLATTFLTGLHEALLRKADIIVHTDGDFQYNQHQIPSLIKPILSGTADAVIGNRQISKLEFMKSGNKYGNILGNMILNSILNKRNIDASSGFRAYTRDCLMHLTVFSKHTYTHETVIHLASGGFNVQSVPIEFRKRTKGSSRLISNVFGHISKSGISILRALLYYRPLRSFSIIGCIPLFFGFLLGLRFLFFYLTIGSSGHIQSLILASILLVLGFSIIILALLAELIGKNIRLNQEALYLMRKIRYPKE